MPNPVAEVVGRLRESARSRSEASKLLADSKSERNRASGDSGAAYQYLLPEQTVEWQAADLIERLSRERDTPEGFWLAPIEPTGSMCVAGHDALEAQISVVYSSPIMPKVYAAMRAAAPQPPSVSAQGGWDIKMTPDDWKTAIENARDPLPMEAEIWAAGADIETAHFVARMLRQQGYYLVNPDHLGWDDINRFNAELHKGQSVYEDAGGYLIRAIAALFGKKPDPVVSYSDAARAILKEAE